MQKFCLIIMIFTFVQCSSQLRQPVSEHNNGKEPLTTKNTTQSKGPVDFSTTVLPETFTAKYSIISFGYNGILIITRKNGQLSGTIFFKNWGKQKPVPLKSLIITGNKIYFIWSITTPEERAEYGGSRYFKQEYRGIILENGKKIKGDFSEGGQITRWEAQLLELK